MRLIELKLSHFGKFHDKCVKLSPGINVIEGKNEAGKSTIHTFIFAMLFGLEGSDEKQEIYDRYYPWENRGGYGGELVFAEGDDIYRIKRSFLRGSTSLSLINEETGEEIENPENALKILLGNINESIYRSSVSIGQMKGAGDEKLPERLKNNMMDLGMARNMELSIKNATDTLILKRKALEKQIVTGIEEEKSGHEASIFQLERELSEKIYQAQEIDERCKRGRAREYDEFSEKNARHQEIKKQLEDIEQENIRLTSEKERWQREEDSLKSQLGKKLLNITDSDIEAGRLPGSSSGISAVLIVFAIILLLGAQTCIISYIRVLDGKEELIPYSLYIGIGLVVLAVLLFIISIFLGKKRKKRKSFYRLMVDKHMRFLEAQKALDAIMVRKQELMSKLSETDDAEYERLHAENDALEKDVLRLSWEQEQLLVRLNEEKKLLGMAKESFRKNEARKKEIKAIRLAQENLFRAADDIMDSFGSVMNEKAGRLLEVITDGAYSQIIFDSSKGIRLKSRDRSVELDKVSRGTIEQVYLCIRIAAADFLSPDVNLPLLLDDTFAFYDDHRTKKAIELLSSCGHQVLIMTCQSREKQILNQ